MRMVASFRTKLPFVNIVATLIDQFTCSVAIKSLLKSGEYLFERLGEIQKWNSLVL